MEKDRSIPLTSWKFSVKSIVIFLTGLSSLGCLAQAQSISPFEEIDPKDAGILEENATRDLGYYRLDTKSSERLFNPAIAVKSVLELDLGKIVKFNTQEVSNIGQSKYWSGRALGHVDGSGTLVYRNGKAIGHFQVGKQTFRIIHLHENIHKIVGVDVEASPDEGDDIMVYDKAEP